MSRVMMDPDRIAALREAIEGTVAGPGDEDYDRLRSAWNLSWDQHPAVVVSPRSAADVAAAVRAAAELGLGVAVQSTGHGLAAAADDAMLIVTSEIDDVSVDGEVATAWIGAGAKWGSVLGPAQDAGLAPLLGSSPGVGAVGYVLGGGLGWLARRYGLAADTVHHFEIVTADGSIRRAGPGEDAELYWALRGGGAGSLGVVTGMEIGLFPVTTVYGGNLLYPAEDAADVLARWREWIATVPDELTSGVTLMNFPPFEEVPEPVRGRSFAIVRGCYCGPVEEGAALIDSWREWRAPALDMFGEMSFRDAATISNDPVDPIPAMATGRWLADLDDEVIDALIAAVYPRGGPPPVIFAEVRHCGGAISSGPAAAYGNRDAELLLEVVGIAPSPEAHEALRAHVDRLYDALGPHLTGGAYLNFLEGDEKRALTSAGIGDVDRLRAVKSSVDPENVFRFGVDLSQRAGRSSAG